MPFFSIYIPCYKNIAFLKRLLDSIEKQTYRDFELIITDDSPDNAVEILFHEFKNKILDITCSYHKNLPALGMPKNWNYGLSLCKGEWIKIMHDDDWFSGEQSLKEFYDNIQRVPSKFIVSAYNNFYYDKGLVLKRITSIQKKRIEKEPLVLVSDNIIGPPSVVCVHHTIMEQYDERLKWRVDIDYYIRILHKTATLTYIDKPLVNVGIGELQVTQEVKNVKSIELPEAGILWSHYGMDSLKSIFVFDGWWRFVRNLRIVDSDSSYLPEKSWPKPIKYIIDRQIKIPGWVLSNGVFSKTLMAISFLTLRNKKNA